MFNVKEGTKNSHTITLKKPVVIPFEKLKSPEKTINSEAQMQEKKQRFENFLTSRKRLSRLSLAQGIYFYEQFKKFNEMNFTHEEEVNEVYRILIFFYKRLFFYQKYGTNKKNKRLEERFVRNSISLYIQNAAKIDPYICKYLNKKWRISRLNASVRATLRAAITEALFFKKAGPKIIICEYTNLVAESVKEEKEVAFFNAILENIVKEISSK